jgi:hypothetical protein
MLIGFNYWAVNGNKVVPNALDSIMYTCASRTWTRPTSSFFFVTVTFVLIFPCRFPDVISLLTEFLYAYINDDHDAS